MRGILTPGADSSSTNPGSRADDEGTRRSYRPSNVALRFHAAFNANGARDERAGLRDGVVDGDARSDGFAGDADAIEAHRRARRRGARPGPEKSEGRRERAPPAKATGGSPRRRARPPEDTLPRRPPPRLTTPSPPRSGASSAATASSVSRPRPSPRSLMSYLRCDDAMRPSPGPPVAGLPPHPRRFVRR